MGCSSSQPEVFAFIEQGDHRKVRDLCRKDPSSPDKTGNSGDTALHHAAAYEPGDDAQCVEALLEFGVRLNTLNTAGFSALHVAGTSGKAQAFRKICSAGGKIDITEPSGQTALHLAVLHGHVGCIQAAIDCGVSVNAPNKNGETMLHTAAEQENEECVTAMLEINQAGGAKVQVDPKSADGRTPLHVAAVGSSTKIVEALIRAGADKTARNNDNKMPVQLATNRGVAMLLQVVVKEDSANEVQEIMPDLPEADETFKPADDSTRRRIQDLMNVTWKAATTRDRGFAKVSEFNVVQVLENTNTNLMNDYSNRRDEVSLHLINKLTDVKTATSDFDMGVKEPRVASVNEFYLFHGTKPSAAKDICQNNFRVDLSGTNKGMLYGPGIYLAEASSKADEYACDDQEGLYRGLYAMLLCRVTVGNPVITEEVTPDLEALGEQLADDSHHCILGDREKAKGTYREFIIRNKRQVFPAFVIIYRRE